MLVKINNQVYRVRFTHYNPDFNDYDHKLTAPGTVCEIYRGDKLLFSGESRLNTEAGDHFNKSIGRKTSFEKAVKFFSRNYRKLFWEEYWRVHNK